LAIIGGIVIGPDGAGVAGALVAVEWGTAPTPEIGIRTDTQGRFAVSLPVGRFRVGANTAGLYGSVEVEVPIEELRIVLRERKGDANG
jgi:hypothetical protein